MELKKEFSDKAKEDFRLIDQATKEKATDGHFSRDRVVDARTGTRQPGRAGASDHPVRWKVGAT